jgi:hypothetical protein
MVIEKSTKPKGSGHARPASELTACRELRNATGRSGDQADAEISASTPQLQSVLQMRQQ